MCTRYTGEVCGSAPARQLSVYLALNGGWRLLCSREGVGHRRVGTWLRSDLLRDLTCLHVLTCLPIREVLALHLDVQLGWFSMRPLTQFISTTLRPWPGVLKGSATRFRNAFRKAESVLTITSSCCQPL